MVCICIYIYSASSPTYNLIVFIYYPSYPLFLIFLNFFLYIFINFHLPILLLVNLYLLIMTEQILFWICIFNISPFTFPFILHCLLLYMHLLLLLILFYLVLIYNNLFLLAHCLFHLVSFKIPIDFLYLHISILLFYYSTSLLHQTII